MDTVSKFNFNVEPTFSVEYPAYTAGISGIFNENISSVFARCNIEPVSSSIPLLLQYIPDVIHGCPDYLGRRLVGGASVGPMGELAHRF
jgi:hypothetical protein